MPDASDYQRLLLQAGEFAAARKTVSASAVQRHVRVGFAKAARLLEDLRAGGVVTGPDDHWRYHFLGTVADE